MSKRTSEKREQTSERTSGRADELLSSGIMAVLSAMPVRHGKVQKGGQNILDEISVFDPE